MKGSKQWIFAGVIFLFLCFFSNTWAKDNDEVTARSLVENWFAAMKNSQFDKAADVLAPQFVSVHTDGIVRNKAQEIKLIKNLHMKGYHLDNFKFSRSGDVLVVTYQDQGAELIDSKPISAKVAMRMAVLQKQGNEWRILAYANLAPTK